MSSEKYSLPRISELADRSIGISKHAILRLNELGLTSQQAKDLVRSGTKVQLTKSIRQEKKKYITQKHAIYINAIHPDTDKPI